MYKKLLFVLLGLFVLGAGGYGLNRLHNRLTDGFSIEGISAPFEHNPDWEVPPLTGERKEWLDKLLAQRFTYLAKGTQSFVFQSADGEYILKFFKQKHLRSPWYRDLLAPVPPLSRYVERAGLRRELKRDKIFSGCKLAYQEMQKDTGVLFLHLNPSQDLPKQLTLIDKLGRTQTVDPNGVAFYIQKRGRPLYVVFDECRLRGDAEVAKDSLDKLFDYLVDRSRRGILDRDPAYAQNLGFIEGRAGNLDVGNLTKDALVRNPVEYKRRVQEHLADLRVWLTRNYPELVGYYDARLNTIQ